MTDKKKIENEKILADNVNKFLIPLAKSYRFMRSLAKKTHDKMPYVYEEVEKIVRSHLIILEKDENQEYYEEILRIIVH